MGGAINKSKSNAGRLVGIVGAKGEQKCKTKTLLPMDLQMFAEGEGATDFTFDDFKGICRIK